MADFWSQTKIKSTRKPHKCEWCHNIIPPGSEALRTVGVWDGDFSSRTTHGDCEEVVIKYHNMCGCTWDDELADLSDIVGERENWEWLLKEYPAVSERVGLKEMIAEDMGHD